MIDLMSDENIAKIIAETSANPPEEGDGYVDFLSSVQSSDSVGEQINAQYLWAAISEGRFRDQAKIVENHARKIDWNIHQARTIHYTKWHYRFDKIKAFFRKKLS